MERGYVISGHVDNNEFVPKSRHFSRSSTPERPPPLSRTDLLREVLPSAVPDGLTLGSKQIRHIARGENCHIRVECPTDPRFSTSPRHRVSETHASGLQIQVPSGNCFVLFLFSLFLIKTYLMSPLVSLILVDLDLTLFFGLDFSLKSGTNPMGRLELE